MELYRSDIYTIEGDQYRVTITDDFYDYLKARDICYHDGDTSIPWSKFRKVETCKTINQ